MKKARYASWPVLGFFVFASVTYGDPTDSSPSIPIPPPSSMESAPAPVETNPYTQTDADGVPAAIDQNQSQRLTPDQVTAIRRGQARAALDKDWLVRGYEKQLQNNAAANASTTQGGNLYYQLSSNKDLAKLAGLPVLDQDGADGKPPALTDSEQPGHSLTAQQSKISPATSSQSNFFLKPLLAPVGAPDSPGLHDSFSFLPTLSPSPLSATPTPSPVAPDATQTTTQTEDSTDIETPGMIAAEKNPLTDPATSDLSLEVLPGESVEHARAHQDSDSLAQLPFAMDANQLHRAQTAYLNPNAPVAPTRTTATTSTKPNPVSYEQEPLPVSKVPVISPVRAPIANPYDILNR